MQTEAKLMRAQELHKWKFTEYEVQNTFTSATYSILKTAENCISKPLLGAMVEGRAEHMNRSYA